MCFIGSKIFLELLKIESILFRKEMFFEERKECFILDEHDFTLFYFSLPISTHKSESCATFLAKACLTFLIMDKVLQRDRI